MAHVVHRCREPNVLSPATPQQDTRQGNTCLKSSIVSQTVQGSTCISDEYPNKHVDNTKDDLKPSNDREVNQFVVDSVISG